MRRAFIEELVALAEKDTSIVLLTGDLGYTVLEPFQSAYPDRFFNAGVAEQNMVGMATGLAEAGLRPFVYSIAPFSVLRPYEFFRNGAVFQQLPVTLVGVGGGVEYSHQGGTHFAIEDVAVLRCLPTVRILTPVDASDARLATRSALLSSAPTYLRLGKDESWVVSPPEDELIPLRPLVLGDDAALVCLGPMARYGLEASAILDAQGISATVIAVNSFDWEPDELLRLLAPHAVTLTIEAHYTQGGLGSAVAEVLAEAALPIRLGRSGLTHLPDGRSGSLDWWMEQTGMTGQAIAERTELMLIGLN